MDNNHEYRVLWTEPGILKSSKKIRREASAMYYKSNKFILTLHLAEMEKATAWLRNIINRCGPDPFHQFSFYMTKFFWADLDNAHALAKLWFEHDLVLNPVFFAYDPPSTEEFAVEIFTMDDWIRKTYSAALEEATVLGKRAREENWSEELLDLEFATWVEGKRYGGDAHRARVSMKGKRKRKTERERIRARQMRGNGQP